MDIRGPDLEERNARMPVTYETDEYQLRALTKRQITGGAEEMGTIFKLKNGAQFVSAVNDAVAYLLAEINGNPRRTCLRIEHPSLAYRENAFFIHFDRLTDDVGELLQRYLFCFQQSGNPISFNDALSVTIIAFF